MGKDVSKDPIAMKASIGLLPETPSVYEILIAEENLNFFCEVYKVPKSEGIGRINGLLKGFGLGGRRSLKVETFPKGKKQKLAWQGPWCINSIDRPIVAARIVRGGFLLDYILIQIGSDSLSRGIWV